MILWESVHFKRSRLLKISQCSKLTRTTDN
nr:MAG TPA: hypothetical protein [Caudoviricetes sp.]